MDFVFWSFAEKFLGINFFHGSYMYRKANSFL
jgi:hypothetical protein